MKKPLLTSLLLLCVCVAFSQKNNRSDFNDYDQERFFRAGLKVTAIANKLPDASYNNGFNYNYALGAFAQINFSKRWGIQPEINLIQQTTTYSTGDASDITNDVFRGGSQKKAPFNYVQVPVLMNMNVGVSKHVKLQAGPFVGFSLNNRETKSEETLSSTTQYKKIEVGAVGGLWIQLPFVNFGGRYQVSLGNYYSPVTKQTGKNQAIQFFIGFTI
ncbi:porin family protein [Ferruginibacter albus]|uniref:porin family protein n=1 Tax=Ferruginibacter albus TaxID=2875540 RepID=UPI001CC7EA85|nr:porin family protein [Ferruginibacter albus]UAY53050.1 PorT family protein [Ferruginibacter albus]